MIENRIAEVLTERFKEEDMNDCFLVNVTCESNNKIVVFVEADDQLTIKMCQKISRFLEKTIEEHGWLPEKYTLDVSSPGTDNPLIMHRQYVKNIGRNASILLHDGQRIEGKLTKVEEKVVTVDVLKEGFKNIPMENINETKILVSFK